MPESKITVVRNGVDQEKFNKMDDAKADIILQRKGWPADYILYAGTVDHPGKNAMAVIKAFEELKKNGRYNGHVILAGMPGNGYEIVKGYADRSAYKDQIIFAGFVTDEELAALYSKCATFAFVSLYEGFGIPPLEAMACGAKVVVSNTSSLPEVVGDIGITVDPLDQEAITEAIYESIHEAADPDYARRVEKHLENYNWKNISNRFERALFG